MNRTLTHGWPLLAALALPAGANATLTIVAEPRPEVARRAVPIAEPAGRRAMPVAPVARRAPAAPVVAGDRARCFEDLLGFSLGESEKIGSTRNRRCD